MRTEIERLVKQLSELQVQQATVIEKIQALESTSVYIRGTTLENTENEDAIANDEGNPKAYCYDRYNKRITINNRVYLITKGKFKVRLGRVIRIDCRTKWVTILELDNTKQITQRKSHNVKIEPLH